MKTILKRLFHNMKGFFDHLMCRADQVSPEYLPFNNDKELLEYFDKEESWGIHTGWKENQPSPLQLLSLAERKKNENETERS